LPDGVHICIPKNPDLGIFWSASEWRLLVNFNGHLTYFKAIWYTLWLFNIVCGHSFGLFFPPLVFFTKKNLATLGWGVSHVSRSFEQVASHFLARSCSFISSAFSNAKG
jgi:hypothetical protein